jgi:hypothetical protein
MKASSQMALRRRAGSVHGRVFLPLFLFRFSLFFFLCLPAVLRGQPGQLALSSQIQYSTVIQGAFDPVTAYIYNTAPPGSASVNYSSFATFPYGNSGTYLGTKGADGGVGYVSLPFSFNSGLVSPGIHSISVTATDTGTGGTLTQSGNVTVLAHGVPAFVIGGSVVQLSSTPPAQEPSVDPLAFGATGGGETFAAHAPNVINDPIAPTAEMDLDSITVFGSPQISITLHPFTNEIASDDPAQGVAFDIDVDGSVPGTYFTTFELNYSDEQDLPGALAPGSEHGFFSVFAEVTASGVTGGIVVPEPATGTMLVAGLVGLVWRRGIKRSGKVA